MICDAFAESQVWWSRKPSSVQHIACRTVIYLGQRLPVTSSGLPATQTARAEPRRLFGLAPAGGCRATDCCQPCGGLLPHLFTLTRKAGGLFSVALSVAFRRPGVTWQLALWSSDFPRYD